MHFSKLRVFYAVIGLFAGFIIFYHLPRQSEIRRKIAFLWYNSSFLLLGNRVVMPRLKILAKDVPHDDPYSPILYVDKIRQFLDPETRQFLNRSRFFAFPSKYKKVFVDTLVEFDRIWRQKLNRTYILYGGTLLGAYRHGETIPWDDDLDVLVDLKYNKTIEQDLKGTKFSVRYKAPFQKLFFTHNGTTTVKYGRWPFIDLCFFVTLNETYIHVQKFDLLYLNNQVFPPTPMPYGGHMFLGPRCPEKVIRWTTALMLFNECCSHNYNHRLDQLRKGACISCWKLHGLFRFVTWRQINATHSQQMISDPAEPNEMDEVYKRKKKHWREGPVFFMPRC